MINKKMTLKYSLNIFNNNYTREFILNTRNSKSTYEHTTRNDRRFNLALF